MAAKQARPSEGPKDRFASWLAQASDQELVALLTLRGDLASPTLASFAELSRVATSPSSVAACLENLDLASRQVLEALCVLGPGAPCSMLADALGCHEPALTPILLGLVARALVLVEGELAVLPSGTESPSTEASSTEASGTESSSTESSSTESSATQASGSRRPGPKPAGARPVKSEALRVGATGAAARLVVNPGVAQVVRRPCGLGSSAAALFAHRPGFEVAEIARRLSILPVGRSARVAAAVSEAISNPATVAGILASGPPSAAKLARRLSESGPVLQSPEVSAERSRRAGSSPVSFLLAHGLIVPVAWGIAEMPREVAVALRGGRLLSSFSPDPPPVEPIALDGEVRGGEARGGEARGGEARGGEARGGEARGASTSDLQAAGIARRAVDDVTTIVETWQEAPAKGLRDGGIGIREVRRVAKLTGRSEAEAALLVELAGIAGLAGPDRDGDLVLPTIELDAFVAEPFARRWAIVATSWLRALRDPSIAGSLDENDKLLPPLVPRGHDERVRRQRRLLLFQLAAVQPGFGLATDNLEAILAWSAPSAFALESIGSTQRVASVLAEARALGVVTGSPVAGLTCFGRSLVQGEVDAATAFLAALGPPIVNEIVLQADLTAIAAGELAPALRSELELLGDVESAGAGRVYRFSEQTLRRAFDAGRTSSEILECLRAHAPKGVPQSLVYLVEDIGRRFGQVRVGAAGCYICSADTALLTELSAAKRTARLGLRQIASGVLVSSAQPRVALETLRQAGYLAALEGPAGALVVSKPAPRRAPVPAYLGRPDDPSPADAGRLAAATSLRDLEEIRWRIAAALEDPDLDAFDDLDLDDEALELAALESLLGDPGLEASMLAALFRASGSSDLARLLAGPGGCGVPSAQSAPPNEVVGKLRASATLASKAKPGPLLETRPKARSAGSGSKGPRAAQGPTTGQDPARGGPPRDASAPFPPSTPPSAPSSALRPTLIAKGAGPIADLLERSFASNWGVRVSYRAKGTHCEERSGMINEITLARVHLEDRGQRTAVGVRLDQIEWARVLTEAEEEALL